MTHKPQADAEQRIQELETELLRYRELATSASRVKEAFVKSLGHELRTPLNAILGMADILLHSKLSETQLSQIHTIQKAGETLLLTLSDVIDYANITSGGVALEPTPFALRPLVESIVELYAPRAHAKNLDISAYVGANMPAQVLGDGARVRQILNQLIDNAIKYTDSGAVMLDVQLLNQNEQTLKLRFRVVDTGIGMPPSYFDYIVSQHHDPNEDPQWLSQDEMGSGMGLDLAYQLTNILGGHLSCHAASPVGTAFHIDIPFGVVSDQMQEQNPVDTHILAEKTVLIVDDHDFNRTIMRKQLEKMGMTCLTAEDGPQALVMLQDQQPDVILMDYFMPHMNGVEVAEYIRVQPHLKNIRMILTSSNGKGTDLFQHHHLFAACLSKPVREHDLIQTVAETLLLEPSSAPLAAPTANQVVDTTYILVVDDQAAERELYKNYLEQLGCVVHVASNGVEALAQLRHHVYDVVLMDMYMPQMDGPTTTNTIRNLGYSNQQLPIIGITGEPNPEQRQRFLKTGLNDLLVKPISAEKLIHTLLPRLKKKAIQKNAATA